MQSLNDLELLNSWEQTWGNSFTTLDLPIISWIWHQKHINWTSKLRSFVPSTHQHNENATHGMEEYISKSLSDRELTSRVYKEHLLNKNQICF